MAPHTFYHNAMSRQNAARYQFRKKMQFCYVHRFTSSYHKTLLKTKRK